MIYYWMTSPQAGFPSGYTLRSDSAVSWSPDSHYIAFVAYKNGQADLFSAQSDGTDAYLVGLLQHWRSWMAEILPSRRDDIIIRRYSLNGSPRPSLAHLGNEYGVSRERIRQLQKDTLKRLRHPARKRRLEHIPWAIMAFGRPRSLVGRVV